MNRMVLPFSGPILLVFQAPGIFNLEQSMRSFRNSIRVVVSLIFLVGVAVGQWCVVPCLAWHNSPL